MSERAPRGAVLIAAASGRALAEAARRAGYAPLVADLFGDSDTQALAEANRLAGDWRDGFAQAPLLAALQKLAAGRATVGLVYGAGFEDRPELLEELARRWPLLGNAPDAVRRAKDPVRLAGLCRDLGIPHPEIRLSPPSDPRGWLVKSVGGAGGAHVAPASRPPRPGEAVYFQRVAPGEPVSALCLGDGCEARALGASRQWTAPAPGEPFRYGGAARPADVSAKLEARLTDAACSLVRALKLVGLNSVDFLVEADSFHLVEINPRPGATLDVFEDRAGELFHAHVEACRGVLPARPLEFPDAAAAAIAYASRPIALMPTLDWPRWTADRQARGGVDRGDPLCTVKAHAPQAAHARALAAERVGQLMNAIEDQLRRDTT